jgi:cytidylate kinase
VELRGRPDVLHVRVVAPFELRVARLRGERNVSEDSARACLEARDRARARYLRRSHGVRLDDPALYHLTVNTGLLNLSQAVDLVVRAARAIK